MSTESTQALVGAAVSRIRTYEDADGRSVGGICGGANNDQGIYLTQAPDGAAYPYVVLRFRERTDPECVGRVEFELEATAHARPRAKEQEADTIAELVSKALYLWRISSATLGVLVVTDCRRQTEPPIEDPEDREIVTKNVHAEGWMFPLYLTEALT